jgi:alpha-amylase
MSVRISVRAWISAVLVVLLGAGLVAAPAEGRPVPDAPGGLAPRHALRGPVTDENFYFVMADRFENGSTDNDHGGLTGDRLITGFDPTSKAFYNGGDLAGLLQRIDYIRGLGTTSIWLTPSFKNKPVQLEDGPSAGYHGYWITDFTQVDPHLGTNEELRALIEAAHARGMKVYFDIITNHTADVIGYSEGARQGYVSKDVRPYTSASGAPFDDRDHAGASTFPPLDAATSFPYHPVLDSSEQNAKVPAWLNDPTLYHNRGDTTFVGENSLYGDFFGLDDLFTEHPQVVQGMIEIYQYWIAEFGIDGFRIDTMKHVDDTFWQRFGPTVLQFARDHGKREFFMFGEVFDTTKPFTSHFITRDPMQAVLDFPFQAAARDFASRGSAADHLTTFFADDDWYTDADSNVYMLPTFLGNHDMGRIAGFIQADNPPTVADDAEWLARDRLAHELMYFSRGNPVVYYGDEQGFSGGGQGDQLARQTMFASEVPEYLDDDLVGTDASHAQSNFDPSHPLYRAISDLAAVTRQHPALRDGAQQSRYADSGPGIYAFSRIDREQQREYVVALNNSEQARTAAVPTYVERRSFRLVYGTGPRHLHTARDRTLTVTVPPLSAVVYESAGRIPRSRNAPSVALEAPVPASDAGGRVHVRANVDGSSFYEVTFYARIGGGPWSSVGTDDNAPYQVFHDVSDVATGTPVEYRAVVLDNGRHSSTSAPATATVPPPVLTIEAPGEGRNVRGVVEVRAVADPERATHVVRFERSVAGGPWTAIGSDDSSPVYTVFDDLTPLGLAAGTPVHYRGILSEPDGTTTTSAARTVNFAGPVATQAQLHYFRPAGDYGTVPDGWGLHMWGDAVDPAVLAQIDWTRPWQRARVSADGWAEYDIPLIDDTKPVNFIMHLPSGDTVPETREPGGDRSFVPLDSTEIWIIQGDPTVYTNKPPTG